MERPLQKSKSDRNRTPISKLPSDVMHRVLTLLSIKEAAKTSLLSREWRYRWRSIPDLVFDGNFATIPDARDPGSVWHNKVMLKIFQILLVHDGPINKFELEIPAMSPCLQINQLVDHLRTKTVKELGLLFPAGELEELLPSSVFALDLNSLKLMGMTVVEPPWSVGFRNLTFLELKEQILPVNWFESFLPKCPLLEELRVSDCNAVSPVFVAPSLKVLFFESMLVSICFKYTPLLSVLTVIEVRESAQFESFLDYSEAQNTEMVAQFAALPALQQLKLGLKLLRLFCDGHVPSKLPASLPNLKVLEIPCVLLGNLQEMRVLVCLIMSSPNLQRLTIVHDDEDERHPDCEVSDSLQMLLEPEDHNGVSCLQRLEKLSIHNGSGTRVELELAKFVLATAPVLKTVFIEPKKGLSSEIVTEFLVELTQFKRISKEAEVKYASRKLDKA